MAQPGGPLLLNPFFHAAILFPLAIGVLPLFLMGLRPQWIRGWFASEGPAVDRLKSRDDVRATMARLADAGFGYLGWRTEQWPLFGRSHCLEFVSPAESICASVFRVAGRTVIHLFTPMAPDAFVLTTNGRCRPTDSGDYIHAVCPAGELEELLQTHRRNVQRLAHSGRAPLAVADQQSRIAQLAAYYRHPQVRREMRGQVAGMWGFYFLSGMTLVRMLVA